jgi:TM2 domain-containing membrane protein YozV
MPMIVISCPTCANTGKVPSDFAGKTVRCPKCKGKIQVPATGTGDTFTPQTIKPPIENEPSKSAAESQTRCPFCSEPIQAAAKKCKHCGEWLDGAQRGEKPRSDPVDLSSYVTSPPAQQALVPQTQQAGSPFNFENPSQPAASPDSKYCPDCGKAIRLKAVVCPHCGVAQPSSYDQAAPAPAPYVGPPIPGKIMPSKPPKEPAIMALCSFLIVGLGQMLLGQVAKGLMMLLGAIIIGIATLGVGAIAVWVISAVDAYQIANKLKNGKPVGEWEFF